MATVPGGTTIKPLKDILGSYKRHTLLVCVVLLLQGCGLNQLAGDDWPRAKTPSPHLEAKLYQSLREGKGGAEIHAQLAELRLAANDPRGARDHALKSLSRSPNHAASLVALARAQQGLGAHLESVETYRRVVEERGIRAPNLIAEWEEVLTALGEKAVGQQHAANLDQVVRLLGNDVFISIATARKKGLKFAVSLVSLHLRQKNSARAKRALEQARHLGLTTDDEFYVYGKMEAVAGRFPVSQKQFEEWVKTSASAERWLRVGRYFRSLYRLKEALWAYRNATTQFPRNIEAWKRYGEVLVIAREPDQALGAWRRVSELVRSQKSDDALSIQLEGAKVFRQAGYKEHALKLYGELFEASADRPEVIEAYGGYLVQLGRGKELVSLVKQYASNLESQEQANGPSMDLNEKITRAVDLLKRAGRIQAALETLGVLQRQGTKDLDVCLSRALLEEEQSDASARDATMKACLRRAGDDEEKMLKVARTWLQLEMPREALSSLDRLLKIRPDSVSAAIVRATALSMQGLRLLAHQSLEEFAKKKGVHPRVAIPIAQFFGEQESWEKAAKLLNTALDASAPSHVGSIHRELAWVYVQTKTWDESKALAHTRAWINNSQSDEHRRNLDRIQAAIAKRPQALRLRRYLLERVLAAQPDEAKALLRLGEVLLRLDDFSAARRIFERALKTGDLDSDSIERVAHAFLKAGERNHAYVFLKMITPSRLSRDELLIALGRLFDEHKLRDQATGCYKEYLARAARTDHKQAKLQSFASKMLAESRYQLAINAYEILADRKPRASSTLEGLARAHLGAGQLLKARGVFERHLSEQSGSKLMASLNQAADVYLEFGFTKEAARFLEEKLARERDRWQAPSYSRLCGLYREHGDTESIIRISKVFMSRGFNRGRAAEIVSRELERAGLTSDALKLLQSVLKDGGRRLRNRRVLIRRAIHYASILEDSKAILKYARAYAKTRGNQAAAWIEAAGFIYEQHHPMLAVRLIDEGMERWPNHSELQVLRGNYLLGVGRKDAAERDFSDALAKSASVAATMKEIRRLLGTSTHQALLARMEKLARAFQPGRVDGYLTLGAVMAASGNYAEAKRAFTRYLDKNPRGHLKVARAYGDNQSQEALKHYQYVDLRTTSVGIKVLKEVAKLLADAGDVDRMAVFIRRFLLQAERPPEGFESISKIWLVLGKPQKAVEWLERAIEHGPSSVRYRKLAKLYAGLGEDERALSAFVSYVSSLPLRPSGRRTSFRGIQSFENAVIEVLGFYLDRAAFDYGRRFLSRVDASEGGTPFLIMSRALLHVREGRSQAALTLLSRHAKKLQGVQPRHVERLVRLFGTASLYSEALSVMDMTRTGRTPGILGRIRLRFMARLGRTSELSLAVAQQVLGASADTQLSVALLLFSEGEYGEARRLLKSYLGRGLTKRRSEARYALLKANQHLGLPATQVTDANSDPSTSSPFRRASYRALNAHMSRQYESAMNSAMEALSYKSDDDDMVRVTVQAGLLAGQDERLKPWIRARVKTELVGSDSNLIQLKIIRLLRSSYAPELESVALDALMEQTGFRPKVARHLVRASLRAGNPDKAEEVARDLLFRTGDAERERKRLMRVYLTEGYQDKATFLLELIAEKDGNHSTQHLLGHLGVALADGQRTEDVRRMVQELCEQPNVTARELRLAAKLNEAHRGPAELTLTMLSHSVFQGEAAEEILRLRLRASWRAGSMAQARRLFQTLTKRFPPISSMDGLSAYVDLVRECVWAADGEGLIAMVSMLETKTGDSLVAIIGFIAGLVHDAPKESKIVGNTVFLQVVERLIERAEAIGYDEQQLVSARTYLLEARQEMDAAVQVQVESRERERASPTSTNNLAYLFARTDRRLDEGLLLVRDAISRTLPLTTSYADTEAWILHKSGRSQKAYLPMKEALHLTDWSRVGYGHAELLFHYAEILQAIGEKEKSDRAYRDCAQYRFKSRYGRQCAENLRRNVGQLQ